MHTFPMQLLMREIVVEMLWHPRMEAAPLAERERPGVLQGTSQRDH